MTSFRPAEVPHLRAAALRGICPICGQGPWPSLGIHAARRHEVTARELKAALGVPAWTSLSSSRVRQGAREVALAMPDRTTALIAGGSGSPRARDIGDAGGQGRRWRLQKASRRSSRRRKKIPDVDLPGISQRIDAGERYADVAANYDVTPSAVWWRVRQWRRDQAAAASVTAVGREHIPGARPKPISLARSRRPLTHTDHRSRRRPRSVCPETWYGRGWLSSVKSNIPTRHVRLGIGGESRKRLPLCHH